MPTLFKRDYGDSVKGVTKVEYDGKKRVYGVLPEVTPGCEWVLAGDGTATEKVDGSCCAIFDGVFYRRYDAKKGQKRMRDGAIPCQPEPDPVTGHWPHWVPVDATRAEDKWYVAAYINTPWANEDATYEAVGPHFQSNPYGLDEDFLEMHGRIIIPNCPRDFWGIKEYLRTHEIEGIVFWRDGEPRCKIKRSDFGFEWPVKGAE